MRTTLDIDDDLLNAAKELATRQKVSVGKAISDLLRNSLSPPATIVRATKSKSGFPTLPAGRRVVTLADVNRLRDEEGI